jgi:hypothetical protein
LSIVHSTFNKKPKIKQQELMVSRIFNDRRSGPIVENDTIQHSKKTDTLNTMAFAKTMVRTAYHSWDGDEKMNSIYYRIMLAGVLAFIVFGVGMAYYGYLRAIYPIDKAIGYLSRAQASQTPEMLVNYIKLATQLLPGNGNPVWSFSTPKTDFGLIQNDLSAIISRAKSISSFDPQSAAYNTGLEDIRTSIKILQTNLEEATPYIYVSFTNVFLSIIWMSVILTIFAIMKKGRAKFKEYETT